MPTNHAAPRSSAAEPWKEQAEISQTTQNAAGQPGTSMQARAPEVAYRTTEVDGVDIFYREAGPKDAPGILLLHGFPSSSHQFRELIPKLADKYHVVAPDFPGYGQSSAPKADEFAYTYDHIADVIERFARRSGSNRSRCTCTTSARRSGIAWPRAIQSG